MVTRSLLLLEILRDSLTDFDWTGTEPGPGPAIAIMIEEQFKEM